MADVLRLTSAGGLLSILPLLVAERQGYLAQEGLEVDFLSPGDGPDSFHRVMSDQADVGIGGLWRPLMYRPFTPEVCVIGQIMARIDSVLVHRPADCPDSVELLAGKVIIDLTHAPSPRAWVAGNVRHLRESAPRFVIGLSADEAVDLFVRGMGDYLLLSVGYGVEMVSSYPELRLGIVSVASMTEPLPWGVLYIDSRRVTGKRRDRIEGFLRATARGRRWLSLADMETLTDLIRSTDAPYASLYGSVRPIEAEILATQGIWSGGIPLPAGGSEHWIDILARLGLVKQSVTLDDVYDPSFITEQEKLGA